MDLLAGKVVVVAGIGPGLGRQIAAKVAGAGAAVALAARSTGVMDEVADELRADGAPVVAIRCDVTRDDDCTALMAAAASAFGGIDAVVGNAFDAGPMDDPVETASFERWQQVYEVTVFGSLRLARAAVPHLRERGGGSITFIGSQIVRRPLRGRGAYASSKAALHAAAQALALEVGGDGIRVNTVVPGRMWGPPLIAAYEARAAAAGVSLDDVLQPARAAMTLPFIPTDAQCADTVVFAVSDLASAITGQAIHVNGGETFNG